jgi:membrane protein implicated in regulation of membrane protease activity
MVWLVAGAVLLLVEFWTANLLFASLGVAALAAGIAGYAGGDLLVTSITFAVASLITVVLLRPIGLRAMHRTDQPSATNVDALVGAEARVLEAVTPESGRIKLRGEEWSAQTESDTVAIGDTVVVVQIRGATAIVSRKGEN